MGGRRSGAQQPACSFSSVTSGAIARSALATAFFTADRDEDEDPGEPSSVQNP